MRGPLRHPADRCIRSDDAFARFDRTRENREQRRLARAVRSDERDASPAASSKSVGASASMWP